VEQRLGDRMHHRRADTAADADREAAFGQMGRGAERTSDIADRSADRHGDDRFGAVPHRLDDQGDGASGGIAVGDGQRDAFVTLVESDDDELPRFARLCDQWSSDYQAVDIGGELLVDDDPVHGGSCCEFRTLYPSTVDPTPRQPGLRIMEIRERQSPLLVAVGRSYRSVLRADCPDSPARIRGRPRVRSRACE